MCPICEGLTRLKQADGFREEDYYKHTCSKECARTLRIAEELNNLGSLVNLLLERQSFA